LKRYIPKDGPAVIGFENPGCFQHATAAARGAAAIGTCIECDCHGR
jgi:hypothetical protein